MNLDTLINLFGTEKSLLHTYKHSRCYDKYSWFWRHLSSCSNGQWWLSAPSQNCSPRTSLFWHLGKFLKNSLLPDSQNFYFSLSWFIPFFFVVCWEIFWKYLLPICGLSFNSLNNVFTKAEVLNFHEVNLSNFAFIDHAYIVPKRIFCLIQNEKDLCLYFLVEI